MLAKIIDFPSKRTSSEDSASLEKTLKFLNLVSDIADHEENFDCAAKSIFAEVCKFTGWPIAHLYGRDPDTADRYVSKNVWYLEDRLDPKAIANFRKISEETVFEQGKGLIGIIAEKKAAKAVKDVTILKQFLRADAAKQSGVHSFFGFPILVNRECIAVAEFYGRRIGLLDKTSLEIMQYVSSQLARVYERDENARHQRQLMAQFKSSVQMSITNLGTGSDNLGSVATSVQDQADKNSLQCQQLSTSRTSIAGNMDTLQQAMQRLVQTEAQTVQSNSSVNKTVEELAKNVSTALHELQKLANLTTQIEGIAKNVSEVSGQVRMLGLNASIEAARAGEAGKGFAIVASEIKSLALQSEQSSQDISHQLGDIYKIAKSSANCMHGVNASMEVLEKSTGEMSNVVKDQHEATETIRSSLDNAHTTFTSIDGDIEGMTAASSDLLQLAQKVSQQVQVIKDQSSDISSSSQRFIEALES